MLLITKRDDFSELPTIAQLLRERGSSLRVRQRVRCENMLRDLHGGRRLHDMRGLLGWTEGQFIDQVEWAATWACEMLDLGRKNGDSSQIRRLMEVAIRQVFGQERDKPAFLIVESCRDRVTAQSPGLIETPDRRAYFQEAPRARRRGSVDFHRLKLPRTLLDLTAPPGRSALDRLKLCRVTRRRTILFGKTPRTGYFSNWCLGDPVDDRASLDAGRVPSSAYCDFNPSLSIGRLFTLWTLVDEASGFIEGYTLDIHPYWGQVLSVRHCLIDLPFLCRMHPRWHVWMLWALGEKAIWP